MPSGVSAEVAGGGLAPSDPRTRFCRYETYSPVFAFTTTYCSIKSTEKMPPVRSVRPNSEQPARHLTEVPRGRQWEGRGGVEEGGGGGDSQDRRKEGGDCHTRPGSAALPGTP